MILASSLVDMASGPGGSCESRQGCLEYERNYSVWVFWGEGGGGGGVGERERDGGDMKEKRQKSTGEGKIQCPKKRKKVKPTENRDRQ